MFVFSLSPRWCIQCALICRYRDRERQTHPCGRHLHPLLSDRLQYLSFLQRHNRRHQKSVLKTHYRQEEGQHAVYFTFEFTYWRDVALPTPESQERGTDLVNIADSCKETGWVFFLSEWISLTSPILSVVLNPLVILVIILMKTKYHHFLVGLDFFFFPMGIFN